MLHAELRKEHPVQRHEVWAIANEEEPMRRRQCSGSRHGIDIRETYVNGGRHPATVLELLDATSGTRTVLVTGGTEEV